MMSLFDSLGSFIAFLSPLFNLVFTIISVPVFGIPLWAILLNFLMCFYIIGFIIKGNVGLGSQVTSAGVGASRKVEGAKLDKKEKERQARIGFHP